MYVACTRPSLLAEYDSSHSVKYHCKRCQSSKLLTPAESIRSYKEIIKRGRMKIYSLPEENPLELILLPFKSIEANILSTNAFRAWGKFSYDLPTQTFFTAVLNSSMETTPSCKESLLDFRFKLISIENKINKVVLESFNEIATFEGVQNRLNKNNNQAKQIIILRRACKI